MLKKQRTMLQIIENGVKVKNHVTGLESNALLPDQVETWVKRAFRKKQECTATLKNGNVVGRSWLEGKKWNWYVDIEGIKNRDRD